MFRSSLLALALTLSSTAAAGPFDWRRHTGRIGCHAATPGQVELLCSLDEVGHHSDHVERWVLVRPGAADPIEVLASWSGAGERPDAAIDRRVAGLALSPRHLIRLRPLRPGAAVTIGGRAMVFGEGDRYAAPDGRRLLTVDEVYASDALSAALVLRARAAFLAPPPPESVAEHHHPHAPWVLEAVYWSAAGDAFVTLATMQTPDAGEGVDRLCAIDVLPAPPPSALDRVWVERGRAALGWLRAWVE